MKTYMKKLIAKYSKKTPVFVEITRGKELEGRKALISGGTSGIGYAIAKAYLQSGAQVFVLGHTPEKLGMAVDELSLFGNVSGILADISNVKSMEQVLKTFWSNSKDKIDILVNAAGVSSQGVFGIITEEDFDKTINTNLKGTLFLSQLVSQHMIENKIKGNILNIASVGSFRPADTSYRISKWGIRGLTLGMAKKLIPYGITVNGIAPGPTATAMLGESNDNLNREKNPAGRMATSEEIAELAKYMVSNAGKLIVGELVSIGGGAGIITFDDVY